MSLLFVLCVCSFDCLTVTRIAFLGVILWPHLEDPD